MRFNPNTYNVMEGVNANAVITLAAQQDHLDFGFNVTVLTRDGTAMGEFTIKQTYTWYTYIACVYGSLWVYV